MCRCFVGSVASTTREAETHTRQGEYPNYTTGCVPPAGAELPAGGVTFFSFFPAAISAKKPPRPPPSLAGAGAAAMGAAAGAGAGAGVGFGAGVGAAGTGRGATGGTGLSQDVRPVPELK